MLPNKKQPERDERKKKKWKKKKCIKYFTETMKATT